MLARGGGVITPCPLIPPPVRDVLPASGDQPVTRPKPNRVLVAVGAPFIQSTSTSSRVFASGGSVAITELAASYAYGP